MAPINQFRMPEDDLSFEERQAQYEKRAEFSARFEEYMSKIGHEPTNADISAAIEYANGEDGPQELVYELDSEN